jgi:hypothetical protein
MRIVWFVSFKYPTQIKPTVNVVAPYMSIPILDEILSEASFTKKSALARKMEQRKA